MFDNEILTFVPVSDAFAISIPGQEYLHTDVSAREVADYEFWTVVVLIASAGDATDAFSRAASFALQNTI